jgi:undecaprenyl-diphosphatase
MVEEPFLNQQIEFLRYLATYRNELLNLICIFINQIDTAYGYLILNLLGWLKLGRIRGSQLFVLIIVSFYIVGSLKDFFMIPRPPKDLWLVEAYSFSFPSGGATNAMVIFGYFVTQAEKFVSRFFFGFLIFAVAFSRLYLGVHYPVDVAAGLLLGVAILSIFFSYVRPFNKLIDAVPPFIEFLVGLGLILIFYFTNPLYGADSNIYFLALGVFAGLSIRRYLPLPYVDKKIHAIICLSIIFVLLCIPEILHLENYLLYPFAFLIGLSPPLIAPWATNAVLYPKNKI